MTWAPDYCSLPEFKEYLRINDEQDDAVLSRVITAASRAIDHGCDRQFGQLASAEERSYPVEWSRRRGLWVADIEDLMTTTNLVVEAQGVALDSSKYRLFPDNAAQKGRPWYKLGVTDYTVPSIGRGRSIEVTARWGWTSVPDTIKQATLQQASRFFKRRDSPFGIAGSPDTGSEMRLLARTDADVEVMIRDYKRVWVFV